MDGVIEFEAVISLVIDRACAGSRLRCDWKHLANYQPLIYPLIAYQTIERLQNANSGR